MKLYRTLSLLVIATGAAGLTAAQFRTCPCKILVRRVFRVTNFQTYFLTFGQQIKGTVYGKAALLRTRLSNHF